MPKSHNLTWGRGLKKAKVTFGVFLPFYAFKSEIQPDKMFPRIREIVLECERLRYDSVWIDDHLMYRETPILECWSVLAALAASTSHIRLGTMVTSAAFRNPSVLAKAASTVDAISNGRLEFGIGAGIQKTEYIAYGLDFPSFKVRVSRMEEAIEVIKSLWTEEKAIYKGSRYQLNNAVCEPKPVQKPNPPITVGGCGEKYTLKVTAKHADRADFGFLPTRAQYKRKLQVLESHCKAVGRPFAEIEKSCWPAGQVVVAEDKYVAQKNALSLKPAEMSQKDFQSFTFAGTPEDFVETLKPYIDLGATHFMLFFANLPDKSSLRALAKTIALM